MHKIYKLHFLFPYIETDVCCHSVVYMVYK